MQKENNYELVGSFELTGQMRVSDPCYDRHTWCAGIVPDMKPGTYDAYIVRTNDEVFGERVERLVVRRRGARFDISTADIVRGDDEKVYWWRPWKRLDIEVGVDSGQCGFFDDGLFRQDYSLLGKNGVKLHEKLDAAKAAGDQAEADALQKKLDVKLAGLPAGFGDNPWYTACCNLTLSSVGAGVIPYGAVSSSGLGDGSYNAFACYNGKGEGVMACVLFL